MLRPLPRYLLIILFIMTLFAPLMVMMTKEDKALSVREKRNLAPRPHLVWTRESLRKFPHDFESWFNDHFGFRETLVYLYNAAYVSIFDSSPIWDVIVGKNKWLFLANQYVLDDFAGHHLYDKERLVRWKKALQERERWLEIRGIHYLFIIPPNKISIYPEQLPDKIKRHQGMTHLEQFTEYLDVPPSFTSRLDLLHALEQGKEENQVYLKSDTHWNSDGAYIAYKKIILHLKQFFPEFSPFPKSKMIREPNVIQGDLSLILNLPEMFQEESSVLRYPDMASPVKYPEFEVEPHPVSELQRFRNGVFRFNENTDGLRTAIFISDSFGSALKEFLTKHFRRIIFVNDARFEDITHLIERERPDVVIDLNVARAMSIALGDSAEIRAEVMAEEFKRMRGHYLVDINSDNFAEQLIRTSQLELSSENPSLFAASGEDPQIYFQLPQRQSRGILNLHCSLHSDKDDVLKIYYATPQQPEFSETNIRKIPLHKGRNDIFLRFFSPVLLDKFRLDPGEKQGTNFQFSRFALFEEEISSFEK